MKKYLLTSGLIFGLLAIAHLAQTILEWRRLFSDPWFVLQGPGIGLIAGALGLWAWRLLRDPSNEVMHRYDETARKIRAIEKRALGKLDD
jgi:H+/Cl- antiporter ClcA